MHLNKFTSNNPDPKNAVVAIMVQNNPMIIKVHSKRKNLFFYFESKQKMLKISPYHGYTIVALDTFHI